MHCKVMVMEYYFIPKGTVCQIQVCDNNGNKAFCAAYKTRKDRTLTSKDVEDLYDAIDDTNPDDISLVLFRDGSIMMDGEEMDKMVVVEKSYMKITSMGLVSSFN